MIRVSRRALAGYAADQLLAGKAVPALAAEMAAALQVADKLKEVDLLLSDITWELERRGALVNADVISARPIPEKLLAELKSHLRQATGAKRIKLHQKVDKTVLGGLKIETANRTWDETVRRKITDLRETY